MHPTALLIRLEQAFPEAALGGGIAASRQELEHDHGAQDDPRQIGRMESLQLFAEVSIVESANVNAGIDDPHAGLPSSARRKPVGESPTIDEQGQTFADFAAEDDPIFGQIQGPVDGLGFGRGSQERFDPLDLGLIHIEVLTAAPMGAAGSPRFGSIRHDAVSQGTSRLGVLGA